MDWLQDHVVSALVGGAALLLGKFGYGLVKNAIGKHVRDALHHALDVKSADPVKQRLIREWVLASVRLAEYSIPDRGQGNKRKAVVLACLHSVLPKSLQGQSELLSGLIEEAVATMDDELKKASETPIAPDASA